MPAANPIKHCPGCDDPNIRSSIPFELQCSPCRKKERNRIWREANPGAMASNAKRWREAGNKPNRPADYNKKRAIAHREKYHSDEIFRLKCKESAKQYRTGNPEKVRLLLSEWRKKNIDHSRKYHREYNSNRKANDPEFHKRALDAASLWRHRNWKPATTGLGWVHDVEKSKLVDGNHIRKLKAWQNGFCYICNNPMGESTVEHIIPRSIGGSSVTQNVVLSCSKCNYSRQHRLLNVDWKPENREPNVENYFVTYKTIGNALANEGFDYRQTDDGYFEIKGNNATKNLYILSTFQCSERNIATSSQKVSVEIQNIDPEAIIIFDNEWYSRKSAVMNALRSKIGIAERGRGARKMDIVEISAEAAREFLDKNHIMGGITEPYRIALMDGNEIYGVGVFADRENGARYECVRLSFRGHVPGGMSRIISALFRLYGRRPITTFIDSRYATGIGHDAIGFKNIGRTPASYQWVFPDRVQHQRYLSNDNKCSYNLLYFNPELTVDTNIGINGVHRIWIPGRWRMILDA
ncbi:MAG: HNH endonuclease [Acidiphilium sp.]|nr:HNH endonuclease [Acidiphilium sp.]